MQDKYHDFDKAMTREVNDSLLKAGVTEYPVRCNYCDEDGRVEMDNNGPSGKCPICKGTKEYMRKVSQPDNQAPRAGE